MNMKNDIKCKIFRFLFFAFILSLMSSCSPGLQQKEFITIGALLPLTGEDSDEGLRAHNGLMIAKEEINESGGILGKFLDIIVLDDRGDEDYVVQQFNALKNKNVAAIIGSSYSGVTMALAQTAERDGIPIISPTASNPDVTLGRPNVFRAIFIDDYQAEVMAYFAHNSLSARTAVVLKNETSGSFMRTAEVFSEAFLNFGGQIIAIEHFSGEDEFAGILQRYADNPPDVFYCPENFIPAVSLINAAYEIGITDTFLLGSDAWDGVLTYIIHPGAMSNVFYTAPFSFDDQDENVVGFVRNYFRTFSQMPLSGSATAYTCVYILADAIKRAGNTRKDDIISAMKETDLNTILGRLYFDENNNPRPNVYILSLEGGVYSTYQKLNL